MKLPKHGPKPFELGDKQWDDFASSVPLPPGARKELESLLGWHLHQYQLDQDSPSHSETRNELIRLHRLADDLDKGLSEGNVMLAMISLRSDLLDRTIDENRRIEQAWKFPSRQAAYRRLTKCIARLRQFKNWANTAAKRLPPDRRGNKTDVVHELVDALNDFLERHNGKKATRKDSRHNAGLHFIQNCMELLGMPGQAENMIRANTKRMRQSSGEKNL